MGASTAKVFSNFMDAAYAPGTPGGASISREPTHGLVVGPRVDVDRDRPCDVDLGDGVAAGGDQLPHRLVAVQAAQRPEQLPGEAERVAEAVVVAADREGG